MLLYVTYTSIGRFRCSLELFAQLRIGKLVLSRSDSDKYERIKERPLTRVISYKRGTR